MSFLNRIDNPADLKKLSPEDKLRLITDYADAKGGFSVVRDAYGVQGE